MLFISIVLEITLEPKITIGLLGIAIVTLTTILILILMLILILIVTTIIPEPITITTITITILIIVLTETAAVGKTVAEEVAEAGRMGRKKGLVLAKAGKVKKIAGREEKLLPPKGGERVFWEKELSVLGERVFWEKAQNPKRKDGPLVLVVQKDEVRGMEKQD